MASIRTLLKDKKKLSFGDQRTLKLLKNGGLSEVFVCSNYPKKAEIKRLVAISDAKLNVVKHTNEELGALCKKPFSISIIGLIKE